MIIVVQGKLGSGKSYYCVSMMIDHLLSGGCVRTNIRLDYKQISKSLGRRLSPNQIGLVTAYDDPKSIPIGDRRGRGRRRTIIVLDEALNWFQSSTSKDDTRKSSWGEWLRQSDKLGQDVYFISQNFERSAKWIRELAQKCIDIIALKDFAILGLLPLRFILPPCRSWFVVRIFDVSSKQRLSLSIHAYKSRIWNLYDTSETFGFVAASSAYATGVAWPRYNPPLWAIWLCLWLIPFFVIFSVCLISKNA